MRSAAVLTVLVLAACGASQAERSAAKLRFLPSQIETTWKFQGDARSAKVRVYADAEVRALPHWKDDINDQLDYANQLLEPLIGLRLTVDSFKDWARSGTPEDALRELIELDKGDGVMWVIGYVAPPSKSTTVMSALGDSRPLGRHLTVRAWAETPEVEALAGRLPDAKDPDRSEVINAHRRHKETIVLLHMLAATLGAIAESDPAWIQAVSYSPQQSSFANRTRELLQLAINSRLSEDTDEALARKLDDAIEKEEWGGWVKSSHDEVVATLHNAIEAGRAGKTAAEIPTAAYDEYKRISELAKRGQTADALVELDNLLTAYPGNATMHELKCEMMLVKPGVADRTTRAACNRVAELAPGDPTVHLAVAEALIRTGDIAAGRAELTAAEDRIGNLPTGAVEAWNRLIAVYTGMGALTWTEQALAKAKLEASPVAASIAQTRARYGVPRGARFVAPDQEAALVSAIRQALNLVYANKFGEAERAIAAANKKWPSAPGLIATRCDLDFRMGQFDTARATCTRALAADPEDSWALYLLGTLLLRDGGSTPAGIDKLKHAIVVDPELGQAWRTLGKAYSRGHDQAAFDQLAKAYQAKFGQVLAP
ncbi:MAG TPA: tetratricopeptide repeat protein [Kofleriaceae bacterium]|jgi:predicted Zn-dependent protease|nr:tetratricopeptide repeat protein [Kofleriaceae bacterium]